MKDGTPSSIAYAGKFDELEQTFPSLVNTVCFRILLALKTVTIAPSTGCPAEVLTTPSRVAARAGEP